MLTGRLRALDLFCGAGGAARGLQQAGFEVTGIDIIEQPDYPGRFIQRDVQDLTPEYLQDYDFVWASPPCQAYSIASAFQRKRSYRYADLIAATRKLLADHPYTCIENVDGAPLRVDLTLTLPMFANGSHRHRRRFELSFLCLSPQPPRRTPKALVSAAGRGCPDAVLAARRLARGLPYNTTVPELKTALGISHIRAGNLEQQRNALNQAVPPVFSHYIAEQAKKLMTAGSIHRSSITA